MIQKIQEWLQGVKIFSVFQAVAGGFIARLHYHHKYMKSQKLMPEGLYS